MLMLPLPLLMMAFVIKRTSALEHSVFLAVSRGWHVTIATFHHARPVLFSRAQPCQTVVRACTREEQLNPKDVRTQRPAPTPSPACGLLPLLLLPPMRALAPLAGKLTTHPKRPHTAANA